MGGRAGGGGRGGREGGWLGGAEGGERWVERRGLGGGWEQKRGCSAASREGGGHRGGRRVHESGWRLGGGGVGGLGVSRWRRRCQQEKLRAAAPAKAA